MIYSFLNEKNIFSKYEESKRYTEQLTDPFPEFERIARNRPKDNSNSKYPKTTDGTTASIVRKTPKRVVQQLPTGVVETDNEDDWLGIVAQFIYANKILRYANEDYDLIQKCWNQIERGLTFGSGASYTPFLNHDGYFCTDMTLPYWGDIFLQKGKKSGYACDFVFMRAWWQKEDVESKLDQIKKQKKEAKKSGEEFDSSWDEAGLKAVIDALTLKDDKAQTPSEEDRATTPEGIEVVTGFQKGVNAKFLTFVPGAKVIIRRKVNKDPRGKIPIDWLYGDIDGSNPLGRGIVELVGGLQNLIDSDMQMYQYNRALMLAPPLIKRGNFSAKKVAYDPNRVIDVGNDPNATVEALEVDTTAIQRYPELYGLQKSQLLNLVNSPDTSISAEVGNPGFSRTPEGLKQQQSTISVDDNYVRKMFEKWFENWSETAINLFFAERSGMEELQLDKKTAKKLRDLAKEGKFDESALSDDDKLIIDYDSATPALRFTVDASTSKMKNDAETLEANMGLLERLENSPLLQQVIPIEKVIETWNSIVSASGVEDPERLSVDIEEFKKQQQEAQGQQSNPMEQAQAGQEEAKAQQQFSKAEQEQIKTEQQAVKLEQEKMKLQQQSQEAQMQAEDQQIIAQLQALGFDEQTINEAINMLNSGYTDDQVLQALGVQYAGR